MTPLSAIAVELRGLCKTFPGQVTPLFSGFDLKVSRGETLAIVGPSACGKSTLLDQIALLDRPDCGIVFHSGKPCGPEDVGKVSVGYIFQRDTLLPWATVEENFVAAAECRGLPRADVLARAKRFMAGVGMDDVARRRPRGLSGGQRQLIDLAQAIALQPEVLLLDEPFAHLDFQTKLTLEREVGRVLRPDRSAGFEPVTAILVTHDIAEAVVLADRVIVVGGYPRGPTRILRDLPIEIPREARNPVSLREGERLPDYFKTIWNAIPASGAACS